MAYRLAFLLAWPMLSLSFVTHQDDQKSSERVLGTAANIHLEDAQASHGDRLELNGVRKPGKLPQLSQKRADSTLGSGLVTTEAALRITLFHDSGQSASMRNIFGLCVILYSLVALLNLVSWKFPSGSSGAATAKVLVLCATWASTSVGMSVVNKALVETLHTPAIITAVQMFMAVVLVLGVSYRDFMKVYWCEFKFWLIVPIFFTGILVSSFYTLQYISLSLMTIFRNLTPLIVLPIERIVMPPEQQPNVSASGLGGIFMMLTGTIVYVNSIDQVSILGVAFAVFNTVCAMTDRLLQRRLLTNECKGLPSTVCTVSNNACGMVPTLLLAMGTHQFSAISQSPGAAAVDNPWADYTTWALLIFSGILGIGICYLGFETQRAISATSFFVLQNLSKVITVSCGVLFFADPFTLSAIAGMSLSICGSAVYGMSSLKSKPAQSSASADEESVDAKSKNP